MKPLSAKQYEAARRIAAGDKIREISQDLSVPEGTIYNWKKRDDFQAYLSEIDRESRSENLARIRHAQDLALDRVVGILEDPDAPDRSVLTAARMIFSQFPEDGLLDIILYMARNKLAPIEQLADIYDGIKAGGHLVRERFHSVFKP